MFASQQWPNGKLWMTTTINSKTVSDYGQRAATENKTQHEPLKIKEKEKNLNDNWLSDAACVRSTGGRRQQLAHIAVDEGSTWRKDTSAPALVS